MTEQAEKRERKQFAINYDDDQCAADWNYYPGRWTVSTRIEWLRWNIFDGFSKDAYKAVLNAFGLKEEDVPMSKLERMSPKELNKIGTKNPHSDRVSEESIVASEVD